MLFRKVGRVYVANVSLSQRRIVPFELDTGSVFTVMSTSTLSNVVNVSIDDVVGYLSGAPCVACESYTKNTQRLVPVYVRNVLVGNVVFDKFYVFVNIDGPESASLIGTDLISACQVCSSMANYGIQLSNVNFTEYEYNFLSRCRTKDVQEIFELCKPKTSKLSSIFNKAEGN